MNCQTCIFVLQERYVQPSILHQLTSSTCMVCRMLSKLVTILNYQKKSQFGRGERPSNKTWFVQNLTCQPFPSHAMQRYQRYDHACGSHVCSPDPWPVGGATFRVLELRSQLRATWLIVARSDVPNFKWWKSGLKLQCLYFVVSRCLLAYYPRSYW